MPTYLVPVDHDPFPPSEDEGLAYQDRPPVTSSFLPSRPDLNIVGNIGEGARMLARPFLAARDSLAEGVDLAQRAGVANSLAAVPVATYEAGKHMVLGGLDTANRWLSSTRQLPGAKSTDDLVVQPGTEDYQINPNRLEQHDFLAPLGLAGMASPVGSLASNAGRRVALTGRHGSLPEEAAFRKLMGQQYEIAQATGDLSTQYDILGGRLINDRSMPTEMRSTMELERARIAHEMGPDGRKAAGIPEPSIDGTDLLSDAGKRSSLPGMIGNTADRRRVEFTPDMKDAFKEGYLSWMSLDDLADRIGVSKTTLRNRMPELQEEMGLPDRGARSEALTDEGRAFESARTGIKAREEKIAGAAMKVGDQVFSGRTHFEALQNAIPGASEMDLSGAGLEKAFREKFGKTAELDGFVTNTGRFVSREEAKQIAEQSEGFKPSLSDRSAFTRDNLDAVSLEHFRAKQEGRKPWEKPLAETYHVDQGPGRTLPPDVLRGFDPEKTGIKAGSSSAAQLEKVTPTSLMTLPDGRALTVEKASKLGINGETFYDVTDGTSLVARLKVHPDNSVGNVMVMDPSLRRQGIATALYDYAAKDRSVPRLGAGSYQTPEGTALRGAYERRGDRSSGEANASESLKPDDTLYSNKDRAGIVGAAANAWDRVSKGYDKFTSGLEKLLGDEGVMRGPERSYDPVIVGRPRSNEGFSMSDNARDGNRFRYTIYENGRPIGDIRGDVSGKTATVDWIATNRELGIAGLRAMREEMRKDFPSVTTFEGKRISGARGSTDGTEPKQSVTMRADAKQGLPVSGQEEQQDQDKRKPVYLIPHDGPDPFKKMGGLPQRSREPEVLYPSEYERQRAEYDAHLRSLSERDAAMPGSNWAPWATQDAAGSAMPSLNPFELKALRDKLLGGQPQRTRRDF